jgi:hypothetical protein
MSSSAQQSASPLNARQLPKTARAIPAFLKGEQPTQVTERPEGASQLDAQELAAVLLDQALILWGDEGESKAVAATLGISESLVGKWRRTDERASPSLIQLVALGPVFLGLLNKVEGRYHRRAERALLDLALAVGEYERHREA